MSRRRRTAAVVVSILALALSACDEDEDAVPRPAMEANAGTFLSSEYVTVDGVRYLCIIVGAARGGVWCERRPA